LSYAYNLGSALTSITDGFSTQVGYVYDSAGRLTTVTNSGASGFSSNYLSNIQYRAWGAMKYVDYGNGAHAQASFNSRLLPTSYAVSNVSKIYPFTDSATLSWTYDYYDDGRVHHAYDADDNKWDRSYAYDHVARISEADTNKRARGQTPDSYHPDPYQHTFDYDVFNHTTSRSGYLYSSMLSDSGSYTNNRRSGWIYDADGDATVTNSYNQTFDGAGHYTNAVALSTVGDGSTQWPNQPNLEITQSYDGIGLSVKRIQIARMNDYDQETGQYYGVDEDNQTRYYLRSGVLGGAIIDELAKDSQNNGVKTEGYVYAGGERIASQMVGRYEHHNAVTGSWLQTNASNRYVIRQERDVANGTIPLEKPASQYNYVTVNFGSPMFIEGTDPYNFSGGHEIDGMPVDDATWNRETGGDGNDSGFVDVSSQGRDGKWREGGPGTRFFAGPGRTTLVWVDTTNVADPSQYTHQHHDDPNDDIVRTWTALKQQGYFRSVSFGFGGQQGHVQNPWSGVTGGAKGVDPCLHPQPPPEADLNANIRTAEQLYNLALQYSFRGSGSVMFHHIIWFRDQVRKFGPWDYNHSPKRTPEDIANSTYDSYGNFQYGATGAAAGFDLDTLLRAAGRAQENSGDVKGDGGQSGGLVGVFTGIGAKAPYGDKAVDQDAIRLGFQYTKSGCHKQ